MKKRIVSLLLALLATTCIFAQSLTSTAPNNVTIADDIQYWVGNGTNEVGVVILFNNGMEPSSFVFGFRWNDEDAEEWDGENVPMHAILDTLQAYDERFSIDMQTNWLEDIMLDLDNDGDYEYVVDGSGYWMLYEDGTMTSLGLGDWPLTPNTWISFEYISDWGADAAVLTEIYSPLPDPAGTSECHAPTSLAESFSDTESIFVWEDNSNTEWYFYWKATNDLTFDSVYVSDDYSYYLQDLTPNTEYQWYVRGICADGELSPKTSTRTFRTECAPDGFEIPYVENFDSYGTSSSPNYIMPTCWTRIAPGNVPNISSTHYNGIGSLYMQASMNDSTAAIMPILAEDVDINNVKITFMGKVNTIGHRMFVGMATNPNDISTVDIIAEITPTTNAWTPYTVSLENYDGEGRYIAFVAKGSASSGNIYYVDSLAIVELPSCEAPTNLSATLNTEDMTSVILSWTNGREGDNAWYVYYKESSATEYDSIAVTENPYILSNLSLLTTYNIFVKTNCGTDISAASFPVSYTTPCYDGAISEFPYSEGFENGLSCIMQEQINGSKLWTSETSYRSTTIPQGTHYAKFYGSNRGSVTDIILPVFDFSEVVGANLSFKHIQEKWGSDQDSLEVVYRTSETDSWNVLAYYNTSITSWQQETIQLPNITGVTTYQIAFRGHMGYGYGVGIDDVMVVTTNVPADVLTDVYDTICEGESILFADQELTMTGVYADSTLLDAGNYDITRMNLTVVSASRTTLEISIAEGDEYELNGIAYNTTGIYTDTLVAQSGCDSIITLNLTVMTLASLPYSTDFSENDGWNLNNTTCTNRWYVGSPLGETESYLYISNTNGDTAGYKVNAISDVYAEKLINVHQTGEVVVSFDYLAGGENNYDYIQAFFVPDTMAYSPLLASGQQQITENALAFGNKIIGCKTEGNVLSVSDTINITTAGYYKLVFRWRNDASGGVQPGAKISNLSVEGVDFEAPCVNVYDTISATICEGTSYTLNNVEYTTEGTYTATLQTENGCDSIVTLNLEILPNYIETLTIELCEGETYVMNETEYSEAGIYTDTLQTENGCDSIFVLNLGIIPEYNDTVYAEIQEGEVFVFNDQEYTASTTQTIELETDQGCDSTITLVLTVVQGLNDVEEGLSLSLCPNPAQTNSVLSIYGLSSDAIINVSDVQGRTIHRVILAKDHPTMDIDVSHLASGIYYIRVISDGKVKTEKLVVK
ncbi:MAG: choice-of-anchor J domain-containing protein [Bacteroidales bacterium]|nr:choice-of-anchor J domain-containing protein [Candidatus Scybalousia scybalohippi]